MVEIFFFNDTATTEIYTLSLHDALPISPNAWKPDQYSNPENPRSHYETTGPEVWAQTEGRITHFVTWVGTGGTINGTGRYLQEASGDRKSTRLNSSPAHISDAAFFL